jgi:hypothetical protein
MVSERRNMPEQERSIKERGKELFVERRDESPDRPPVKPFAVYLRETPATPLSGGVKALLWIVGILVLLLFVAAIWRVQRRPRTRPRPATAAAAFAPARPGPLVVILHSNGEKVRRSPTSLDPFSPGEKVPRSGG